MKCTSIGEKYETILRKLRTHFVQWGILEIFLSKNICFFQKLSVYFCTMAERGEAGRQIFVPAATLPDLYQAAVAAGKLSSDVSAEDESWLARVDRSYLSEWLKKVWAKTQRLNDNWSERRFREQRDLQADWSIDGMVLDEKGEVVGASVWSTYNACRTNAELRFTTNDLISSMSKNNRIIYPLSPYFESVLFWRKEHNAGVQAAIEKHTGAFDLEDYQGSLAGSDIKMARVRKSRLGTGQFAQEGIIVGQIGFFDSRRLQLGYFGFQTYIQRVRFPESSLVAQEGYVMPTDPENVKAKGGKLMEEKYPDVWIRRIDPEASFEDFIATALSEPAPDPKYPMVLSYTTPRVWLDELPKHGPGRTTNEPTVSHL